MMKRIYSFLWASLICSALFWTYSCKPPKGTMAAAREAYSKMEYHDAGESYKAVYSKTKNKDEKNEASFKTAECYRLSNDMKNAENWYSRTVKADPKNTEAEWRYAQTLKANQKFTEAIVEFNKYKNLVPSDAARADREIKGAEYALKWKNEKTRYVVDNVKPLNTKWSDFSPQYFKKDQLFFTSDREKGVGSDEYGWTGNGYTDLYVVRFKVDKKNPVNIKYEMPALADKDKLNGKLNDGTICFDSKYSVAYLTKCNYDQNGKGNKCRLYTSVAQGSEWGAPEPLAFASDSFNSGQPSLSKDGQVLFFSSDMPGGFGGKDLWFVTYSKKGKTWGDPVNLGSTINTEGDEMFPYIHEDGTLYFSSNGHTGLGGVDIFFAKGAGTDWSDPINMKSPINSGGDDFSIILSKDKESGYFSSNRDGTRGQDDIWSFRMTPLIFTLSGISRDAKTKDPLPNTILTITSSSDTGKIIVRTDDKGYYKVTLKAKTDYELFGAHEDYTDSKIYGQSTRPFEVSADLVQDVILDPIPIGDMIPVQGIYYDLDRANIRPDAALILDSLVTIMKKYPRVRIELGSHTDCRSDSAYNQDLSQRRADSAVAYIVSRGIDSLRLVAKGYGESQLVNDCACEGSYVKRKCTEEEHQMNRRTTVKFIDNKYVARKPETAAPPKSGNNKPGTNKPGTKTPPTTPPKR